MNTAARIALTVALSVAAVSMSPFLLIFALQGANNLVWQLSYLLPGGLVGAVSFAVGVAAIAIPAGLFALVIYLIWRKG
jgi:hypothetical protein